MICSKSERMHTKRKTTWTAACLCRHIGLVGSICPKAAYIPPRCKSYFTLVLYPHIWPWKGFLWLNRKSCKSSSQVGPLGNGCAHVVEKFIGTAKTWMAARRVQEKVLVLVWVIFFKEFSVKCLPNPDKMLKTTSWVKSELSNAIQFQYTWPPPRSPSTQMSLLLNAVVNCHIDSHTMIRQIQRLSKLFFSHSFPSQEGGCG